MVMSPSVSSASNKNFILCIISAGFMLVFIVVLLFSYSFLAWIIVFSCIVLLRMYYVFINFCCAYLVKKSAESIWALKNGGIFLSSKALSFRSDTIQQFFSI